MTENRDARNYLLGASALSIILSFIPFANLLVYPFKLFVTFIHEGGHALYEQGLPASEYGLPSGEYVSLGIHESQSRLWENNVGRSLAYWKANFSKLQKAFPENFTGVTFEDFYKAMNIVKPSLIRTSADELTYHFHVSISKRIKT